MYKLSVPVNIDRFRENKELYLKVLRRDKVDRVFLCGPVTDHFLRSSIVYTDIVGLADDVSLLKSEGYEVGFWIGGFGHGVTLVGVETNERVSQGFTLMRGSDGKTNDALCPMDENYKKAFADGLKQLAKAHPDYIMIDDDFRLNTRRWNIACCCDLHLKEYYRRLGYEIPREEIFSRVMTGSPCRERDIWLDVQHDSIIDFAKYIRKELDTVAPEIAMSACAVNCTWGFDGVDCIEFTKILAGEGNHPYLRTSGAPYHYDGLYVERAIERTRLQCYWCKDENIELFSEGDVYPRPRYYVPARTEEMFDAALIASGETSGILKYMYDYNRPLAYEDGYSDRHYANANLRSEIAEIFADKKPVGVRVVENIHLVRNYDYPEKWDDREYWFFKEIMFGGYAAEILSSNGISTEYSENGRYPVAVFAENAKYISEDELENGAFIDAKAALILKKRGIDTGICDESSEMGYAFFEGELFEDDDLPEIGIGNIRLRKIKVSEKAHVLSRYLPDGYPAAYTYENANGQRFYCLAVDEIHNDINKGWFYSYHRQNQLIKALEWLSGKKLPAVCKGNPKLYMLTSESEDGRSMSVIMINNFMDEIPVPTVKLAKKYASIRTVGADGSIDGDTVTLSRMEPYGIAAFEVKM